MNPNESGAIVTFGGSTETPESGMLTVGCSESLLVMKRVPVFKPAGLVGENTIRAVRPEPPGRLKEDSSEENCGLSDVMLETVSVSGKPILRTDMANVSGYPIK